MLQYCKSMKLHSWIQPEYEKFKKIDHQKKTEEESEALSTHK